MGKSTVASEAGGLLREAGVPHAVIDLARIAASWPTPSDDPWNERLVHRNLACMWSNFRANGAERLILSRVLEHRGLLERIVEAVPGADIVIVCLRAPLDVIQRRIQAREAGRDASWYLGAGRSLAQSIETMPVEDHVVDNDERPAREVAEVVLRIAGWLA